MPTIVLEITEKGAAAAAKSVDSVGDSTERTRTQVQDIAQTFMAAAQGIDRISQSAKELQTTGITAFAGFDQAMANTRSIAVGTEEEFDSMREMAKKMSEEMPASAEEIANGYYTLASAGLAANEIMENTPAILKLATATAADFETSAGAVTAVMDIYGDKVGTANDVSDVLMNTVKGFKTTLPELAGSLSQSAGAAATAGVSFETLAAATGILRQSGIEASQAGTGLNAIISRLAKQTPEAQKAMEKYGIQVITNADGTLDLTSTMQGFNSALSDTEPLEKMNIMQTVFGIEHGKSAIALVNNSANLGTLSAKMGEAGSVNSAFNIQMEGTANQLQIMENRMENAQATLGEKMLPATLAVTEAKIGLYSALTDMPGPLGDIAGGAIAVTAEFGGMLASIMMMVPGLIALKGAHVGTTIAKYASAAATGVVTAATWLWNAALAANPIFAIIMAITALVAALVWLAANWDDVADAAGEFGEWLGEGFGQAVDWADEKLEGLVKGLEGLWGNIEDGANDAGDWLRDRLVDGINLAKDALGATEDAWNKFQEDGKNAMDEVGNNMKNFTDDMADWAHDAQEWGADMWESFQKGFDEAMEAAGDWLEDTGEQIGDWLGFSDPPPKGALHNVPEWGEHLAESYAKGIRTGFENIGAMVGDSYETGPTTSTTTVDNRKFEPHIYNQNAGGIDLSDPVQERRYFDNLKAILIDEVMG